MIIIHSYIYIHIRNKYIRNKYMYIHTYIYLYTCIYIHTYRVCVYIYLHIYIYISIPLVFWSNISRQQLGMELPGVKHFLSKTSLVSLGSYCPSLASETLGGPCFSENWECILYAEPYILCMCIYIYIHSIC